MFAWLYRQRDGEDEVREVSAEACRIYRKLLLGGPRRALFYITFLHQVLTRQSTMYASATNQESKPTK
jgi:hypothetical protein